MGGWKTYLVAGLQLTLYMTAWDRLTQYLDPKTIAYVAAISMATLRLFTEGPDGITRMFRGR